MLPFVAWMSGNSCALCHHVLIVQLTHFLFNCFQAVTPENLQASFQGHLQCLEDFTSTVCSHDDAIIIVNDKVFAGVMMIVAPVRTGPPVGVAIGSLPVTPNTNGEIGVLCVESVLAGIAQHNKT